MDDFIIQIWIERGKTLKVGVRATNFKWGKTLTLDGKIYRTRIDLEITSNKSF